MTPKEKAEDLIMRFNSSEWGDGLNDIRNIHVRTKCALIALSEIRSCINWNQYPLNKEWAYWNEVKQELEKL